MSFEVRGSVGTSQRNKKVAAIAPDTCAAINGATSIGLIPAKVFEIERAKVTAGFANEVDEVNQYAAVM